MCKNDKKNIGLRHEEGALSKVEEWEGFQAQLVLYPFLKRTEWGLNSSRKLERAWSSTQQEQLPPAMILN